MAAVHLGVHQGWDCRANSSFLGGHRQDIFKTVLIESCQTQNTRNKNTHVGAWIWIGWTGFKTLVVRRCENPDVESVGRKGGKSVSIATALKISYRMKEQRHRETARASEGRNEHYINDCGSAVTQAMYFSYVGECGFMAEQNRLRQITRSKKTSNKTSLQEASQALLPQQRWHGAHKSPTHTLSQSEITVLGVWCW